MRIRWKFFLILLAFSLAPLLVVTLISQHGTKKLGHTIAANTRQNLAEIVSKTLHLTAKNSSEFILQSKNALEFSLLALAHEAERVLSEPPPGTDHAKIYYAVDFEKAHAQLPGLTTSPEYLRKSKDGSLTPQPISFEEPVFYVAPGVDRKDVSNDIMRLARLKEAFQAIYRQFGQMIHWSYISLESGVHISYPGHGFYPRDYDPRKRPWYLRARDDLDWTFPIVDATTGLVTFTASKRIQHPDGSPAGVVALDILITEVLGERELANLWSSEMRAFMVATERHPRDGETGLVILAQKDYQDRATRWHGRIDYEWLSSIQETQHRKVVADLRDGQSGFLELDYNGIDSIWAYAPITENIHFIIVVPKSVVMALPERQSQIVLKHTLNQLMLTGITVIGAVVLLFLAALFGSKATTKTLLAISQAARRLARGDFSVRLNIKTGDERDQVIQAFNKMVPKLKDHLRIHQALNLAMEIQQNLLPHRAPKIDGVDIAGKSIYCNETGGDYYDYFVYDDQVEGRDRIGIVLGDVSGHGIPSALLMTTARALIRKCSSLSGSIAGIVSDVNHQLTRDVKDSGRFMTLFYSEIDAHKRRIRWVRAGHDPALFYDPATDSFEELMGRGMAMGVDRQWQYEENSRTGLQSGQIILLSTDGIREAVNQAGEMFGRDRICKTIRENAHLDAQGILAAIIDGLKAFQKGRKSEDDLTLVVMKMDFPETSHQTGSG
jgi:sigma-B regulation protein RsbU (phosphoserine phosphatase)